MHEMLGARRAGLTAILEERRREIQSDVQVGIRDARADRASGGRDDVETCGAGVQADIAFALLQMKGQTLARIEEALVKLEAGTYGYCVECGEEILEQRLRALPFAVRCTACEERREHGNTPGRGDRAGAPLFSDTSGY
jgi:DnaK suppressor protein